MVIMNNLIKNRDEQVSELREKTEKNVEIAMYTRAEVGNKISQIEDHTQKLITAQDNSIASLRGKIVVFEQVLDGLNDLVQRVHE